MSSPSIKTNNDSINNKQRKSTKSNSTTKSTSLDTRAELADLIKKKAETSVGVQKISKYKCNLILNNLKSHRNN